MTRQDSWFDAESPAPADGWAMETVSAWSPLRSFAILVSKKISIKKKFTGVVSVDG
jgi:hypothetical protein